MAGLAHIKIYDARKIVRLAMGTSVLAQQFDEYVVPVVMPLGRQNKPPLWGAGALVDCDDNFRLIYDNTQKHYV
jgi:hypothetical protein